MRNVDKYLSMWHWLTNRLNICIIMAKLSDQILLLRLFFLFYMTTPQTDDISFYGKKYSTFCTNCKICVTNCTFCKIDMYLNVVITLNDNIQNRFLILPKICQSKIQYRLCRLVVYMTWLEYHVILYLCT